MHLSAAVVCTRLHGPTAAPQGAGLSCPSLRDAGCQAPSIVAPGVSCSGTSAHGVSHTADVGLSRPGVAALETPQVGPPQTRPGWMLQGSQASHHYPWGGTEPGRIWGTLWPRRVSLTPRETLGPRWGSDGPAEAGKELALPLRLPSLGEQADHGGSILGKGLDQQLPAAPTPILSGV